MMDVNDTILHNFPFYLSLTIIQPSFINKQDQLIPLIHYLLFKALKKHQQL